MCVVNLPLHQSSTPHLLSPFASVLRQSSRIDQSNQRCLSGREESKSDIGLRQTNRLWAVTALRTHRLTQQP